MGFISRPAVVERNTYSNIKETGFFTFNHISESYFKAAHQTSARYDKEVSEFEKVGLTPVYKDEFYAPYVEESSIQVGLLFKEKIDIKLNDTILVIGEIQSIYVPEKCLREDGFLDIEQAGSITCSGLDSYHSTNKIARLSYAKPNRELVEV
jgi:flavin reductase (DIM6/NTAB) family NADH-FMN oxidoreductase RutF